MLVFSKWWLHPGDWFQSINTNYYLLNSWTVSVSSNERHEHMIFFVCVFIWARGHVIFFVAISVASTSTCDLWLWNGSNAFENIHDVNDLICWKWVHIDFFQWNNFIHYKRSKFVSKNIAKKKRHRYMHNLVYDVCLGWHVIWTIFMFFAFFHSVILLSVYSWHGNRCYITCTSMHIATIKM